MRHRDWHKTAASTPNRQHSLLPRESPTRNALPTGPRGAFLPYSWALEVEEPPRACRPALQQKPLQAASGLNGLLGAAGMEGPWLVRRGDLEEEGLWWAPWGAPLLRTHPGAGMHHPWACAPGAQHHLLPVRPSGPRGPYFLPPRSSRKAPHVTPVEAENSPRPCAVSGGSPLRSRHLFVCFFLFMQHFTPARCNFVPVPCEFPAPACREAGRRDRAARGFANRPGWSKPCSFVPLCPSAT